MAKRKTATMQAVADTAGVSVSTVSRVLNSSDFAAQGTRDRVIKAAARMGYSRAPLHEPPGSFASLAGYRGGPVDMENVVLLASQTMLDRVAELQGWIYRDIVPTLHRVAKRHGFHLILSSYAEEDRWDPATISAKRIAGVLWMNHNRDDLLARVARQVPVVVINDDTVWPPQTCVMSSNQMVLYKAVEHLAQLGHKRIGFFDVDESPGPVTAHCRERLDAYRKATEAFGVDVDPSLEIREKFGNDEHPQAVARAMDRMAAMSNPPTAIVSPLTYSIQFLKETRKRSIRVPRDLSIVAIDNAEAAEVVDPALTAVDCMFSRCAEIAIELLLQEKQTPREFARTILIEPKLIVRHSTAAPGRGK